MINNYYVVTAAHCHRTTNIQDQIHEIVLGERIIGKDVDCLAGCQPVTKKLQKLFDFWSELNGVFSFKKAERFYPSLSDITVHEDFTFGRVLDQANDIALVRLPRPVEFRAEIKAMCLPWKERLPLGMTLVAGKAENEIQSPS